jgi:hypothetical protein
MNKEHSPAQEIPGCALLFGISVGEGKHTASQHGCDLQRIDAVVLRFAAVDCFHIQGMTKGKGNLMFLTEVCHPIPTEHAFNADDNVRAELMDDSRQFIRSGRMVTVVMDFTG